MKPLEPYPPVPARRERHWLAILFPALMIVVWLGLSSLMEVDMMSKRALLVIMVLVAPIAIFTLVALEVAARLKSPATFRKGWQEIPPPADFMAIWAMREKSPMGDVQSGERRPSKPGKPVAGDNP